MLFRSDADLRNANLRNTDLRNANLRNTDLREANLRDANLRDADLWGANLRDANLEAADLRNANLRGANLRNTDFRDANLRNTDFRNANLRDANLRGAHLEEADLSSIKRDLFEVLSAAPEEVPGLLTAMQAGRVDGYVYVGECACLVGTIANLRGVAFEDILELRPDAHRPIERLFFAIRKGPGKITIPGTLTFLAPAGMSTSCFGPTATIRLSLTTSVPFSMIPCLPMVTIFAPVKAMMDSGLA